MTCFVMALALVLGLTQCKKEQVPANNENEGVRITLTVDGGNNGSRVAVNPNASEGYATVTFENGDVIYVGNNGAYCGYLTYDGTNFSGNVNPTSEADYLHFYFMGNKGTTSEPSTVSITDQTSKYPVISYAHSEELYSSSTTSYTAKLQNYCSIVKFTTNSIPTDTDITVKGMYNTVSVNFGANNAAAATPTLNVNPYTPGQSGTGDIILHAVSITERWAILLEQSAVNGATVTAAGYSSSTCNVPAIANNSYYNSPAVEISLTAAAPEYYDKLPLAPEESSMESFLQYGIIEGMVSYNSSLTAAQAWALATYQAAIDGQAVYVIMSGNEDDGILYASSTDATATERSIDKMGFMYLEGKKYYVAQ